MDKNMYIQQLLNEVQHDMKNHQDEVRRIEA